MFTWSLSAEQQRQLAERLTAFLSPYDYLSDSYIIEFFSKDHWHSLPTSWQPVLQDLTYQQVADLLLDPKHEDRRYPSVWPLSLLAFRATAHALAFPRACQRERGGGGGGGGGDGGGGGGGSVKPEEFLDNQSQSSLLGHVFRKHVKPKKQHEIRKLGSLVKQLCEQTDCSHVVDVGSGQGHLTRFLSFGLGLSVTAMEADRSLVATATKYDGELLLALEKEQKQNSSSLLLASQSPPRHVAGWVNPKASWESFIEQLSAAEPRVNESAPTPSRGPPADFVLTGLHACGDLSATLLRHFVNCPHVRGITSVACCYMKVTTRGSPSPPAPEPGDRDRVADPSEFGYPMSRWVAALPGHGLSYKAREGACHAVEEYTRRLREGGAALGMHCYRATLETLIAAVRPDLRRAGIQTIKNAHLLPFTEYARLGLARVGLTPGPPLEPERVEAMLRQRGRVVVYFSLALLLAPAVETLVLLDRMIYLQENGLHSQLLPLFHPDFSPRNLVLVAMKP
ncbi:methyltransferase-like protein 25B [Clinocottus analis]|uniref:methyltransferase-like protein 25B n=1 Tax=Clinocottus analis TaxID=304258 RepID=UPI0035BF4FED